MKVLRNAFIILVAVVCLLPLGDVLDDDIVNFSHIKNSIESIDGYDDAFVNDITKLGLVGEALSEALTSGKNVFVRKCNRSAWNDKYMEFVNEDGYVCFYLVSRTDADDEVQVAYPTSYNVYNDSYDDYSKYVDSIYRPISAFLDIWNEYNNEDNNAFEDVILMLGLIATGIFGIIYVLVVFLFDSISMIWGVILCLLRLIGVAPLPISYG